jgi:hypothetical protein
VRAANYLARAGAATLRSYTSGLSADRCAEKMFPRDHATLEVLRKSATSPATTTTVGWATELAAVAIYDQVQSITSISAAAAVIDRGLKLSLDRVATMRVPGRVLNAGAAGMWTAEDDPAPARQLSFTNAAILQPRKLSVIMAYSREQAASSNIEAIVRQSMGEAAGLALDARLFSATAADSAGPPGLFVGVTPITAATGGGSAAMITDIGKLFAALADNAAGKTAVIVAAMSQATTLKMTVGPQFDVPIVGSTALPTGTVAAIEVGSFVSGFNPVPEFRASDQSSFHFDDTAPADPVMGGQPVKSMFQIDALALKMDLWAAWGLRAAGHVQFVSGVSW